MKGYLRLGAAFGDGAVVDRETLQAAGLIKARTGPIKVLGTGELTKKLTVKAAAFSATALSTLPGEVKSVWWKVQ